jgi:hypothetical protein
MRVERVEGNRTGQLLAGKLVDNQAREVERVRKKGRF